MNPGNPRKAMLPRRAAIAILMCLSAGGIGLATAAQEPTPTAGVVRKADRDTGSVTIKHEAIRNLDMGAMTMVFQVRDKAMLDGVQPGDKVMFKVIDNKGKFEIQELQVVK